MSARIPAFVVWSLAAACAVYWAMRLLIVPVGLPGSVQPVSITGALQGDVAALFASPQAPSAPRAVTALASRFRLIGVMSPKTTAQTPPRNAERGRGQGIALIAVDGKPPRPYRVGAALDDALVLLSVTPRSASIGPAGGEALLQLDVAPLTAAATGARPPAAGLFPSMGQPRIAMPGLAPAPSVAERGDAEAAAAEGSPAPDAEPGPR
jgi:general secretion pathway protein C